MTSRLLGRPPELPAIRPATAGTGTMTADLHRTVVGRWHQRLAGNPSPQRNHWRTKTMYFQSVDHLVAADPTAPLTWKTIVAATHPRGCRSTFYEVTGAHARDRLLDELIRDGQPDSIQLALRYQRSDAVDQLLDETKVWSYWPYRERFLTRLGSTAMSESARMEALHEALRTWASHHRAMAATLDYTPPACAVEDLVVIAHGRMAAIRAASTLADVMRSAVLSTEERKTDDLSVSGRMPTATRPDRPEPLPLMASDQ